MAPYHALLRDDLRGDPLVFLPGSLYVTQALDRRTSGTYYTPRQLAEEVVQHALDPVVYSPGPAEERDAEQWKLKPASELLDLKVADIAMGSGAFLVAACRYLAERLQEAWTGLGAGEWTAFGNRRDEAPDEPPVPADPLEREQLARRLVAERCLYGVDKNPMAVEMAKLSLWLITLAQRPAVLVRRPRAARGRLAARHHRRRASSASRTSTRSGRARRASTSASTRSSRRSSGR